MAFNILDIINSSGVKASAIKINDTFTNIDTQLNRTFLDTIRSNTKKLSNIDCSDNIVNNSIGKVGNYLEQNLKFKNVVSNIGILGDFGRTDDSLVDLICHTINANFKTITAFIEATLKILINILKKIEKLKTKIDSALLDFTKELRDCFIRIVIDAKLGTEKIIRTTLSTDFILDLMKQCDCIMELIKENFSKCKDLKTADDVALCLKTEYSLSPESIINQLNEWTKNNLTDNIENGFNIMEDMMSSFLDTLIKPFRLLVKEYCNELRKKRNVNFLLLKDPSIRCLFEYTEEFDSNGNKYFGMSILDMIESMKKWSVCIDSVCSSLHDDIKRKVQEYNEKLKLDFKYWNSEITIDIYMACIAANSELSRIRPTTIREMYRKNSGKGTFIQLMDFYKTIGNVFIEKKSNDNQVFGSAVTKVLGKIDGDEIGLDSVNDGDILFYTGIEPLIIKVYENLSAEIYNEYYYSKTTELINWDYKFKKSNEYIKSRDKINQLFLSPNTTNVQNIATTEVSTTSRVIDSQYYMAPDLPVLNTYTIPSDFKSKEFTKPIRVDGETLSSFYKRWWNA